jgi:hypothetical protein
MSAVRIVTRSVGISAVLVLSLLLTTALFTLSLAVDIPVLTPIACELTGGDWQTECHSSSR